MRLVISSLILLILDFIWIATFMGPAYKHMITKVQKSQMEIRKKYAFFAYTLMIIGLAIFVIPNVPKRSLSDSLVYGGSFGLLVYGIYDCTCAAVLKNWDENLAILDIIWGVFVYSAAAYLGSFSE